MGRAGTTPAPPPPPVPGGEGEFQILWSSESGGQNKQTESLEAGAVVGTILGCFFSGQQVKRANLIELIFPYKAIAKGSGRVLRRPYSLFWTDGSEGRTVFFPHTLRSSECRALLPFQLCLSQC